MSTVVQLRYEDCVRTRSRAATCHACIDACPTEALTLDGRGAVALDHARCVTCAACQGACPTEAIDAGVAVGALFSQEGTEFRCGDGLLPCVAALALEDLVALARSRGDLFLVFDLGCDGRGAHPTLRERIDGANAFLAAAGVAARVHARDADDPPSLTTRAQRSLRRLLQRAEGVSALNVTALDRERLRSQRVPERRKRLLASFGTELSGTLPCADAHTVSDKLWNTATCTACSLCANVCPTGALRPTSFWQELRFDASRCVRCSLCHDTCEPAALTLAPQVDLAALTHASWRALGRMRVGVCGECGTAYRREGNQTLCPRCQDQEDDVLALHGRDRRP